MDLQKDPAIIFRAHGNEYGYVAELGKGRRGHVYLLRNLETNELIVRKVSHPRVPAPKDDPLRPDYEACINELIKAHGSHPNIVPFLGYTIVRYPGDMDMISHVSYYKYCNIANFHEWLRWGGNNAISPPLVARFLHQTLSAAAFLFRLGFQHGDLHIKNIFMHYENGTLDFYIGDFDHAHNALPTGFGAQHDLMNLATSLTTARAYGIKQDGHGERFEPFEDFVLDLQDLARQWGGYNPPIKHVPLPFTDAVEALAERARKMDTGEPIVLEAKDFTGVYRYTKEEVGDREKFPGAIGPWYTAGRQESGFLHMPDKGWDSDLGVDEDEVNDEEEVDEEMLAALWEAGGF